MLKNILSNWFGMLMLGIMSVILTPAMVHGLGNMYFGMWALAGSILDYSGLLEMGMRATLFRFVAYFRGANQRKELNETFSVGMVVALVAMSACLLLSLCLPTLLSAFFKFTGKDRTTFAWVIILMGASIAFSFPGQYLGAYLRGLERFDLYNLGLIFYGAARTTLLLILLKLGGGVLAISSGVFAATIFFVIFNWFLVRRADPDLEISFRHLNLKRARDMVNFGFYSFINNAGETLRFSTDSFVIARMLGISLVTPFNIATRLTEYFKMLIGGICGPIMVRLSVLSGKESLEELREEFLRSTRFSMLLSIFIGSLLILDGKTLIRLWVGPSLLESYPILVVLTIAYIVTWGQSPSPLLLFARARYHRALSWWTLIEGVANLFLSIIWATKYGLLGVALGTAVPLLASKLFVQPWYILKDLDLSAWQYFERGLARASFVGVIFMGMSWSVSQKIVPSDSYLSFLLACGWQSLFFLVLAYVLGLPESDRSTVRATGRHLAMAMRIVKSSY